MHRLASMMLLLTFILLGSGAAQFVHESQHEHEDAQRHVALLEAAGASPAAHPRPAPPDKSESESDCPICAQFHAPLVSTPITLWLIDTGMWVRYVSMRASYQHAQNAPMRLSCRGPPASC